MAEQVRSVVRAFELLRFLNEAAEPLSLAELATRAQLPKSTTRRLLMTLTSLRAVETGVVPGTYTSGPGLAAIGGYVGVQPVIHSLAGPFLGDIVELTGEAATLAVLDRDTVVFATQKAGPHPVQVPDATGTRFPPHTVSPGFVFLSAWPESRLEDYLGSLPDDDIDPSDVLSKIDAVRDRGYVWHIDGWVDGVSALAAPVVAGDGSIAAALGAFGPTYRFPGGRDRDEMGRALGQISAQLSAHLP